MGVWGTVILLFVGAWILQIVLTIYQNRHYSQTIREMTQDHTSGHLGVGVIKKRLGIGSVVILVSDLSGTIVSAKELTGVTVFSRFQSVQDIVGKTIDQLFALTGKDHRTKAIQMAAERIVEQREKQANGES